MHPGVFCEKGVLKIFVKFTAKHLFQSLYFDKFAGLRPATLLKMRLWKSHFLMNCAKLRCRHDGPIRRRGDVPLRRLGDVPLRRRWVFHLRRTCDVTGSYRETLLRRRPTSSCRVSKDCLFVIKINYGRVQFYLFLWALLSF